MERQRIAVAEALHAQNTYSSIVNRNIQAEDEVTCWRPFCLLRARVAPEAPLPWGPFTLLAFQVPFSAQKAY